MVRSIKALLVVGSLLIGTAVAAPPSASTDEGARELFVHGQMLYQEGRYKDALMAFEVAYRMSQRPAILRSIAYCHEKLGQLEQASVVLHQFRGLAPQDKLESIDRAIRRIEADLAAAMALEEEEANAEALILEEEETEEEEVEIRPEPEPPAPVYESPPKWRVNTGPVVLYSVGGVAGLVGGLHAWSAIRARGYALDKCIEGGLCRDTASKHLREDRQFSIIADSGFVFAGAAILGGTVWMVVDNKEANQVGITAGLGGIGVRGQF